MTCCFSWKRNMLKAPGLIKRRLKFFGRIRRNWYVNLHLFSRIRPLLENDHWLMSTQNWCWTVQSNYKDEFLPIVPNYRFQFLYWQIPYEREFRGWSLRITPKRKLKFPWVVRLRFFKSKSMPFIRDHFCVLGICLNGLKPFLKPITFVAYFYVAWKWF
jgi:hypothetical protein